MATTYFGSKPSFDWNPNGTAESGHDFINQINEQKGNVQAKTGEYQQAKATAEGADKQFSDMFQNRQSYSDMYNQASQQAKVDQREQEYQKNLDALNATRRAMYTLPSATNANSEVRLSQAQRDAALNRNLGQYQNLYSENSALAQQAGQMYNTALGQAMGLSENMLGQQQQDINTAMANYQTKMQAANDMYNQLLNERNILRSIYGDMYDDEYNHRMQELEIWADNLNAETQRYAQQQANYRAQLDKQLSPYEQYMLDLAKGANSGNNVNVASTPDSFITSGGEYKSGGKYGTTTPTTSYDKNGNLVNTYVAPMETVFNNQSSGNNGGFFSNLLNSINSKLGR